MALITFYWEIIIDVIRFVSQYQQGIIYKKEIKRFIEEKKKQ